MNFKFLMMAPLRQRRLGGGRDNWRPPVLTVGGKSAGLVKSILRLSRPGASLSVF